MFCCMETIEQDFWAHQLPSPSSHIPQQMLKCCGDLLPDSDGTPASVTELGMRGSAAGACAGSAATPEAEGAAILLGEPCSTGQSIVGGSSALLLSIVLSISLQPALPARASSFFAPFQSGGQPSRTLPCHVFLSHELDRAAGPLSVAWPCRVAQRGLAAPCDVGANLFGWFFACL